MTAAQTYVAALRVNEQRWLVMYTDETRTEALRTLGRWASTPGLGFRWYDAALMAQQIRGATHGR